MTWARNWRKGLRFGLAPAGLAFAIHVILPQVKELPDAIHKVETGSFWWIFAALGVSLISYIGAAISLQAHSNGESLSGLPCPPNSPRPSRV